MNYYSRRNAMSYGKKILCCLAGTVAMFGMHLAYASVTIPIYLVSANGQGQSVGTITAEDSFCGVLLTPNLTNLPPGMHGFHVHINPSCDNNGMAAGGHLDPAKTDAHNGPYNQKGHLGDLPVLIVNQDGTATLPTLAPRFKLAQMMGHAFMIHAGGDNYSDKPEKLGGGGARIACGVIK
jgi:superoxide dismutase, Cu-Zn family